MDLRITRLTLRNFMGVRSFDFEPDGKSASVHGDNSAGKTTLATAWHWLLFGKDTAGSAAFEIKTLGPDGEPEHMLEHEVEAEFTRPDGEAMTLRKVYHEVWTKKRGSATEEFTGHTTDHYVDGVPVQQKEYQAAVDGIGAGEDAWRLLTDPMYFAERLPWKERRELLLQVCGDVTRDEVLAAHESLADLRDILGKRSVEEHQRVVASRRRKINNELDRIPVRIDEVEQGRPGTFEGDTDQAALEESLEALRAELREAEDAAASARAAGPAVKLRAELAEAKAQLAEAEADCRRRAEAAAAAAKTRLEQARDEQSEVVVGRRRMRSELQDARDNSERYARQELALRQERDEVDAEAFEEPNADSVCAACGQDLPQEQVEAARAKALAAFNRDKADRLADLDERLEQTRTRRAAAEQHVEEIEQRFMATGEAADQAGADVAAAEQALESAQAAAPDPNEDEQVQAARSRVADIESQLDRTDPTPADGAEQLKVADVRERIGTVERQLARVEQHRRADERVAELKREQRRLAAEYEDLEGQEYMLEQYTRARVRMLEEKINERFRLARFKLFKIQVNGGLDECCEVTYRGVPYTTNLNHGARVQVGLDVVRTLQQHYQFAPPVFIDQAESVTELPDIDCQVVRLIVTPGADELSVTLAEQEGAAAAAQ